MIVVVMDPDPDRFSALVLAVVGTGVEALLGQDPLVTLDLPVVPGRIDPDALVATDERADRPAERFGDVVAAVIGHQAGEPGDAVRSEERPSAMEEPDGRGGLLVLECFGVGQAGEPIDHRVEIGVAHPLAMLLPVLDRAPPVGPPAATLAQLPDLLHVHVEHVSRVAGEDPPWPAEVLPVGGDISYPVQSEALQPSRHRAHAAADPVAVSEFAGDPAGRPLPRPSPLLDQLHHWCWEAGGTVCWCAGVVLEAGRAGCSVAGYPLRERGAGDVELRGDVRDRSAALDHLGDGALSSEYGQRGVTVGHGTGLLPDGGCLDTTHRAGQGPVPSSSPCGYNVMTRNT